MTFSICVHESFLDESGGEQHRFGVAVTTRLAGVGTLCPFVNEHGAVATQSLVNVELGEDGIRYLADGLRVDDALSSLLRADEGKSQRQLHGVDRTTTFAFSGPECRDWFGHLERDGYTVAGNLLVGESVIDATAAAYETSRGDDQPLAFRLAEALDAGHQEGGDRRSELPVHSAAIAVRSTEETPMDPYYNDIRIDATETPIQDLRATLDLAEKSYTMALERYEDAYADDP